MDVGIKKDCFAYMHSDFTKGEGNCRALKELYCKNELCKFYKKNINDKPVILGEKEDGPS